MRQYSGLATRDYCGPTMAASAHHKAEAIRQVTLLQHSLLLLLLLNFGYKEDSSLIKPNQFILNIHKSITMPKYI